MTSHSWEVVEVVNSNVGGFTRFLCRKCGFSMLIESDDPEDAFGPAASLLSVGRERMPVRDCREQLAVLIMES